MRPLSLEITGLHSFRERRVIDFEPLLRDNLFGIFGPTGGGKSTILDAMTLALFGMIERTSGKEVASAINAGEKECAVAFTFAVRQQGVEHRYRAERTYRILKSGIKSEARLVDLSVDPPVTLADKTSEVSGMVETLLGIRSSDFRLSVVLPQGAFAEFLHMRARERGEMLQRLFGLEDLGKRINDRLRDYRTTLESVRIGMEARLESLSAYNDETVQARRTELEHAATEAKQSREQAAGAEDKRNKAEALYELVAERNQLLQQEGRRTTERERLDLLRAQLARAEEAAALEGSVKQAANARARLLEANSIYQKADEKRAQAEREFGPLRDRKEWADQQKGSGGMLTALEQQINGLEGIVEMDERILPLISSIEARRKRQEETESRVERGNALLENSRQAEAEAKSALLRLKEESETHEEKEKSYERQASAIQRLELLARQHEETQRLLATVAAEEKELAEKRKAVAAEMQRALQNEREYTARRTRARTNYEEARLGNALGEALPLLQPGKPCPLCGAAEHPAPYSHAATHNLPALAERVEQAEQALTGATNYLREREREETSLAAQCDGAQKRRAELEREIGARAETIAQVVAETEYKGGTDTTTLRSWEEKIAERLTRTIDERKKLKEEIALLEATLKQATETLTAGQEKIIRLKQTITSEKEEREREEKELQEAETKRAERLRRIGVTATPGESGRELAARKNELGRLKREVEEIDSAFEAGKTALHSAAGEYDRALALREREEQEARQTALERDAQLKEKGFGSVDEWQHTFLGETERTQRRQQIEALADAIADAERRLRELSEKIGDRDITPEELAACREEQQEALRRKEDALTAFGKAEQAAAECTAKNAEWKDAVAESERSGREYATVKKLSGYLQGNAFINFLADEQLQHICRTASTQLLELTGGRLEIGSRADEGFFIRDNGNAGAERPPGSLSGGETFLVSLALSLALSDSLQVGRAPMEFFFLDEGFGTLDDDLLETVLDSLERLRATSQRAIGVISHVPQLRERIARRLIVTPASGSSGTDVRLDVS